MCYASKQISYWYMYDFLLDILFLRVVTISGVHPSLQIYIIMISSTQNLIHLREVAYLVDILSFTSTLSFLCYFFGGSVKAFALSACPLLQHLDALVCGEDYFPYACLYEAFPILLVSLVLMRLSSSIFTTGCHKHKFFICLLVSL